MQVFRGRGVHHSLTTPYGVEKSIENPLPRTGGAAPPLGRKKQDFELLTHPRLSGKREKENFLFQKGIRGLVRGRGPGRGLHTWFVQFAQFDIGKLVCCVAEGS